MKIAVHDGRFYADDVFSVAAMMVLEPNLQVIRSRDPKVLAGCDLVIGVGGEYCPTRNTFDYHQKGGVCCRENGIPYSGFGLLWKQFGERICGDSGVALRVEQLLVQQIDAGDRGVGELHLSQLILQFNPSGLFTLAQQDEEFFRAVFFARGIIQRTIRAEKTGLNLSSEEISRIESERICLNSLREREDSRIVVLPQFCSWKKTISRTAEALFVIFPNFLGEMKRFQ